MNIKQKIIEAGYTIPTFADEVARRTKSKTKYSKQWMYNIVSKRHKTSNVQVITVMSKILGIKYDDFVLWMFDNRKH